MDNVKICSKKKKEISAENLILDLWLNKKLIYLNFSKI